MLNNKPSGRTWIRFIGLFTLTAVLGACSSAPKQEDTMTEAVPAPVVIAEAKPAPEVEAPPPPPPAEPVFRPDYPERYVVKKGDTLWDIAQRFLKDPWLWPKVWYINPEIRNPHLIYPGEVIALHYVEGKPYLTLEGVGGQPPPKGITTVKLSPKLRVRKLDSAIETIPRSAIEPFLQRPRVVTEEELDNAPYIVSSFEGHLISGEGNTVYARNITNTHIAAYDVVRPGEFYRDPETNEKLGLEVVSLSDAHLIRGGDPATLVLSKTRMEVLNGDKLMPSEERRLDFNFLPFPPARSINGQIISVFDALSQIGQYDVVVLNRGQRDGVETGNILAIYQQGREVFDSYKKGPVSRVQLPEERAGLLMVFRTYEKVSYALIMEATRAIHVNDRVTNP